MNILDDLRKKIYGKNGIFNSNIRKFQKLQNNEKILVAREIEQCYNDVKKLNYCVFFDKISAEKELSELFSNHTFYLRDKLNLESTNCHIHEKQLANKLSLTHALFCHFFKYKRKEVSSLFDFEDKSITYDLKSSVPLQDFFNSTKQMIITKKNDNNYSISNKAFEAHNPYYREWRYDNNTKEFNIMANSYIEKNNEQIAKDNDATHFFIQTFIYNKVELFEVRATNDPKRKQELNNIFSIAKEKTEFEKQCEELQK